MTWKTFLSVCFACAVLQVSCGKTDDSADASTGGATGGAHPATGGVSPGAGGDLGGFGGGGESGCPDAPTDGACPDGCDAISAYPVDPEAACADTSELIVVACLKITGCGQAGGCAERKADGALFFNPVDQCLLEPALEDSWEQCDGELESILEGSDGACGGAGGSR